MGTVTHCFTSASKSSKSGSLAAGLIARPCRKKSSIGFTALAGSPICFTLLRALGVRPRSRRIACIFDWRVSATASHGFFPQHFMRAAVAVQSGIDNDFAHIGNLVARVYPAHMHFGKDVQDLHVPGCAGAARL